MYLAGLTATRPWAAVTLYLPSDVNQVFSIKLPKKANAEALHFDLLATFI